MQYPLPESIGDPDLLVGRQLEFSILDEWISLIPRRASRSMAILARRKSGKTAILQRIFNRLWSENDEVIPFYINVLEKKMWYPSFAVDFYRAFASQYISFLERDPKPVRALLTLEQIKKHAVSKSIDIMVTDVDYIRQNLEEKLHDQVWGTASSAPHRYAALFEQRILVMIDEFQNTGEYIFVSVKMRVKFQRPDGKEMEIDLLAEPDCGRALAVEVKKNRGTCRHRANPGLLGKNRHIRRIVPEKTNRARLFFRRRLHAGSKTALRRKIDRHGAGDLRGAVIFNRRIGAKAVCRCRRRTWTGTLGKAGAG